MISINMQNELATIAVAGTLQIIRFKMQLHNFS